MKLFKSGDNLKNKKVLIMGLGTKDGGLGAALYASKHGAEVTVTDLQKKAALKEVLAELNHLPIKYVLGAHRACDFRTTDLVIRNPGIKRSNRFLQISKEAGIPIESPIGLFSEIAETEWIGITGTKGKSFTTHLTNHILNTAGVNSVAAGNNCISPLRHVDDKSIYPVLELSSWQLKEMNFHKKSPHIACWLNFFPDHMNWYNSMEEYYFDKESILRHQHKNDILILPADDPLLSTIKSVSKKYFFSSTQSPMNKDLSGSFIQNNKIVWKDGATTTEVISIDSLPEHLRVPLHLNLILPAVCLAVAKGIDVNRIAEGISSFPGIPHRFQLVAKKDNLSFINDSAATTPNSVIKALDSVRKGKIVLIAGGGGHKNLNYADMVTKISKKTELVVLFKNDPASTKIREELKKINFSNFEIAKDMQEAVTIAKQHIKDGEEATILLSPGCSGAPFFVDLFQRGNQFISEVLPTDF